MAEALKQSDQSISRLDDDTLIDFAKKLRPKEKVVVSAFEESYALNPRFKCLKQFPPDLNLRDSQTVSDDGDSVH
ncbi:hypothetical protein [Bradyrhizobium sp. JR3.5]